MTDQTKKDVTTNSATDNGRPKSFSRRALIKGGVTAMPAILTLQSGAALAVTSNLVSGSLPADGVTHCLDTSKAWSIGDSGNLYDLGEPPIAPVTTIPDRDHHFEKNMSPKTLISEGSMCVSEGTEYYYQDSSGQFQIQRVPSKGIVLSSGAYASIVDYVVDPLL